MRVKHSKVCKPGIDSQDCKCKCHNPNEVEKILYEFNFRFEHGMELDRWLKKQLRNTARAGFKLAASTDPTRMWFSKERFKNMFGVEL